MKRVLLLFASLVAVLALLWLFAGRGTRAETAAPAAPVAPNPVAGHADEGALERSNPVLEPARASLSPDMLAASDRGAQAASALVRVQVLYMDSSTPVRAARVFVGPPPTESVTDEHGVATLEIPEGSHLIRVRVNASDAGDPFVPYERLLEQVVAPGRNEVVVRVDRGIDLHGIVRESATGRPIRGAHVNYRGFGYRTQVESNEDGSFVCAALLVNAGNACPLNVERDGYLPLAVKPEAADLEPGASPMLVLLETGITVSGRILDSERKPIAGAWLEVWTPATFRAISDELGHFEFSGLQATEHATLHVQTQSWSNPPILDHTLDLGALSASRFDVEFEVSSAIEVRVFAELADGTALESGSYEVDWGDGSIPDVDGPEIFTPSAKTRVLPRGAEVELRATARAPGTDDRSAVLRGSAHARTDAHSPLEVHLRLTESGRLEIPPAPAGAAELHLDKGSDLLGALDVQLLDADTGEPIEGENSVIFARDLTSTDFDWLSPGPGGWVRIWQHIGTRRAWVHFHSVSDHQVTISIPRTGYAKTEWRLRTKY